MNGSLCNRTLNSAIYSLYRQTRTLHRLAFSLSLNSILHPIFILDSSRSFYSVCASLSSVVHLSSWLQVNQSKVPELNLYSRAHTHTFPCFYIKIIAVYGMSPLRWVFKGASWWNCPSFSPCYTVYLTAGLRHPPFLHVSCFTPESLY